jgi:hypothetical protein
MDPSAIYYDGPKNATKFMNEHLWPQYMGLSSKH